MFVPDKSSTTNQRSPEVKIKLGEALMKAIRDCGDLIPRYSQHLLSSLLSGVRDPDEFVRASSLSNIGEVSKLLRFSIGPIIHEVRIVLPRGVGVVGCPTLVCLSVYTGLSVCLYRSVCLSIQVCLSVYTEYVCLCACLFACLSVYT
ncbi:hypothetical protein QZH41_020475, partial [Actinostola sp. cb2023]